MAKNIPPLLIAFLFYFTQAMAGRPGKVDSLETLLKGASDIQRVDILNSLSEEYVNLDLRKAEEFAEQALSLLANLRHQDGLIRCLNSLSFIKSSTGVFEEALALNDSALNMSGKNKNRELLAESYNHLFSIHFKSHKSPILNSHFLKSSLARPRSAIMY